MPLPDAYPKPLSNVNSVYETPPESTEFANPFDTQLTDTPYLTPTGLPCLPHLNSLTVK